jgi:HAD superfamily hydrolase (TIGR01459 family)
MLQLDGLSQIARQFDGMLIDQFGVIHDGARLYPHASDVLEHLSRLNIPVAVMTNSGKRAPANQARLLKMGVAAHQMAAVVSSGEVAKHHVAGKRAIVVGKDGEDYGLEDVTIVQHAKDAEIMLILGSNAPKTSLNDYREQFRGLSIPAICCNPDQQMLTPNGLQPAPGAIASVYEEMGGKVQWIGKPYREIYDHAVAAIGNPKRVLCIGDSAEHDVAGGRNAGHSTLLVMTGISAGLDGEEIEPKPDFVLDQLRW